MAIIIPHRFLERLVPTQDYKMIRTLIIGTFNPGIPIMESLTVRECEIFQSILATPKFQKFSQVMNFYDRPQNRFWKIMDLVANSSFYNGKTIKTKNPNGIKFYSRMERMSVFRAQLDFCLKQGIFITDIVRQIEPPFFDGIYDNFADSKIERAKCLWNTDEIIAIIEKYRPRNILVNFKKGSHIGKISGQLQRISDLYPAKIVNVPSTSGAAGNTYAQLYDGWATYLLSY